MDDAIQIFGMRTINHMLIQWFSWYPAINFHSGRNKHHFNYPKSPSLTDHGSVWNFPSYITGWWFQPLWKILVSWDDYSQYMEKSLKPPTR